MKNYMPLKITKKRTNKIRISITQKGEVSVTAPSGLSNQEILKIIDEKSEWIEKNRERVLFRYMILNNEVKYLGKICPVEVIKDDLNKVEYLNNSFKIYTKDDKNEYVQKLYNDFLISEAKKIIPPMIQKYLDFFHLTLNRLEIKKMYNSNGICTASEKYIRISYHVLHYDMRYIEYVCLHEVAHLIEANHQKAFYKVIERAMPDYKSVLNKYRD